jgi:hypothetical protein
MAPTNFIVFELRMKGKIVLALFELEVTRAQVNVLDLQDGG